MSIRSCEMGKVKSQHLHISEEWSSTAGLIRNSGNDHASLDIISIQAVNLVVDESLTAVELAPRLAIDDKDIASLNRAGGSENTRRLCDVVVG